VEKPEGKRPFEDPDIGERIILRWLLEKEVGWWYGLD
jgi:hypothetical protein